MSENPVQLLVLIIGLGNPILGDDGIGWRVVEEFEKRLKNDTSFKAKAALQPAVENSLEYEFDYLSLGGLALMERVIGYDEVILVDAITTGTVPNGTVILMNLDDLPVRAIGHLSSGHDTTLQNALKVGKEMGAKIPDRITIVGIETDQVYNFSEELSFSVNQSIPEAVNQLMELLK